MTEEPGPRSRPATKEEVVETLSFALRFDGRRPFPQVSSLMARITAEHLAEHMQRSGLKVVVEPPASAPTTSHHGHPSAPKPDER